MTSSALLQQCTDCGYVYDPAEYHGISLVDQDEWECPGLGGGYCGATADKYDVVEPDLPLKDDSKNEGEDEVAPLATEITPDALHLEPVNPRVKDIVSDWEQGTLILRPDWQRDYVWEDKLASQLIESLFLRLPVPLIYLAKEEDGTEVVVDGQQRLTAIVQFIRNQHLNPAKTGDVRLTGLEILTSLNGKTFGELPRLDRENLRGRTVSMVRMEAPDPDLKLTVFRRLNTGSVKLNAQELRNAAFRGAYNDELKKLALDPEFLDLIGNGTPNKRMLDVELVLRFCAWNNQGFHALTSKNLGRFLDQEMERGKNLSVKSLKQIEAQFKKSVQLTKTTFGSDKAFRRYIPDPDSKNGIWETRQINKALYDVVMFGFTQYTKPQIQPHTDSINEALIDLMATDERFKIAISSGTSDPTRVKYRFTKWLSVLDQIVKDDPQARSFSREFKRKLFLSNRTCALCKQEIRDMDDAHVHHVEHYWRGGKTIPENAALAHRYCNLAEGGGKKNMPEDQASGELT